MRFTKKKLKRIMMEIQELLGMISVEELIINKSISNKYQEIHYAYLKTC